MILTFNLFCFPQDSDWGLYSFQFSSLRFCHSCWFLCLFSIVLLKLFLLSSKSLLITLMTHFRACELNLFGRNNMKQLNQSTTMTTKTSQKQPSVFPTCETCGIQPKIFHCSSTEVCIASKNSCCSVLNFCMQEKKNQDTTLISVKLHFR